MSNYQDFEDRHIGPSASDEAQMLGVLGYSDIKKFIADVVPENIHIAKQLKDVLDGPKSEVDVIAELRQIASQNQVFTSLIGSGYYGTITPPVIKRNVLENPAWYTAYTPYQPEISQGRLEALFAFQTVICDMTSLALANASMLDEGTAAAEAMTLARRSSKTSDDAVFLIEEHVHPQTKAVVITRAKPLGIKVVEVDSGHVARDGFDGEFFGLLVQYPDTTGEICEYSQVTQYAHSKNALVIAATDLLALTLLKAPGEWGADIAVGSAQRFGIPMGFGGPHAGFMAVRTGLERSLPGRLVGQSVDSHGNPAFRLALQTREQHIRRDKATSNICTAQVLLANMSAFYAMWHGPKGLAQIAERIHGFASRLQKVSSSRNDIVFDTVTVDVKNAEAIHKAAQAKKINFGKVSDTAIRISFDETTTEKTFADVLEILGLSNASASQIADSVKRTSAYLQHPVFNTYFSETAMLRYLRTLADRDLALDRTMIPLGSCTMKLNATTEMEAVTWPEFASLHPFAPVEQTRGSRLLIDQLSKWLVEITGYDAVSLQPNAGSQGEFAGLLAIRNYHDSRGDQGRNICLIPSSAHGTNAASAVMAGMKVVVIECDDAGNVSVDDLKAKIAEHGSALAALMVTYPSTHGVFESAISEICELVHDGGGQVYVDGANLNALVGTAQPGKFGADVSHLNLHKTFCIPHGGGGPGVGPVIAKAHLAPFLPNHPMDALAGPATGPGPISAAPFGSASILPISWAYIRLMGGEGLTHATEVAILNANYMASRLKSSYPILYTGNKGLVAHECILDVREITKVSGVTVDDIAKRLMDFGFHAPTMSFPVAGTLMIEPTESEDVIEMNRFIDAMIAIRGEIQEIIDGKIAVEESALRHAPHTIGAIAATNWERSYPRERGAFPATLTGLIPGELIGAKGKYWPTTGRIDGAYGDRNLVCSCPPIEAFA
ncbi:MAG: aminomethyl-transferring glycine dehydrogenase [Actinobacteria bacterium]|uniref:glycine dehydrogenase (aminomethyl-transferring) n=1 Tax=freshwater metagenome TaxID=449393 RepID=A0A6J6ZV65_9ZZZZ|nr:aminomethyl-transferring glycine dehydrogenase [Actinomycetota bacterium]MSW26695.1 aminomethyl-transferring glycine dehydrogenase [Actinomycetota bacterium]MSW34448.1 aminomethyl-transferring glycine dehydrogenase [Actinomycetota bacterium]MSX31404.1 aminomethyl-transferring glycine dehydrogenase [Actinomycetota bacterium]MSX51212.1 aminomethyl-transferring glycine dehydrogenase [Actinomycetota bacterium]